MRSPVKTSFIILNVKNRIKMKQNELKEIPIILIIS